jgi:hypothetical protein
MKLENILFLKYSMKIKAKVKLSEIFRFNYGTKLDLNKMSITDSTDAEAVCFISRTSKNLGLVAYVKRMEDVTPIKPGLITVALGGEYLLSAYIQNKPFYSAQNVGVLTPRKYMGFVEKLFYCLCIGKNRFKYSAFGREANKTLRDIEVPSEPPKWVRNIILKKYIDISIPFHKRKMKLEVNNWKWFRYSDLFKIGRGQGPRLRDIRNEGTCPFVTSIDKNNGWKGWTIHMPMHEANVITVNRNGSVAEAFYQPREFCSTEDVHIFNPKFKLNQYIALFLITLIRMEKYRYSFGRKWGIKRMNETLIKLPVDRNNHPDLKFMDNYIKSLSYSKQLRN